jgi:hypothetical protein
MEAWKQWKHWKASQKHRKAPEAWATLEPTGITLEGWKNEGNGNPPALAYPSFPSLSSSFASSSVSFLVPFSSLTRAVPFHAWT